MKLLLMRHAHTEQSPEKQDFERILTDQGQAEAMEAANFLDSYRIDKMIVSYVKRTLQTANIIEEQIPISENEVVKELYNGTRENMIELLSNQEDTNKHILVIGHNPLIYTLALEISDSDLEEFEFLSNSSMPPARIIVIDFPSINSWKELKNHKGKIAEIFTPSTSS